ncbi:MAG: AAA family ATPase [Actinomycetes bacterium]|jgi:hypothetical protein|nr:AAA family ATPase [Actinomycetes bacterium]
MASPTLTAEQQKVCREIEDARGGLFFVHGKGGTGKSFIINTLLRYTHKRMQVLAPTNLACHPYEGDARTIHSYFYSEFDALDEGFQNPDAYRRLHSEKTEQALRLLDTLVLDEISMVRSDTLEMIHRICCVSRDDDSPFGGLQVVLVGDLFQLPPIVADLAVGRYLNETYGGAWFFHAPVIRTALDNAPDSLQFRELSVSVRHENDRRYARVLEIFRRPDNTPEQVVEALDILNSRAIHRDFPTDAIRVAPRNAVVNEINNQALAAIDGQLYRNWARVRLRDDVDAFGNIVPGLPRTEYSYIERQGRPQVLHDYPAIKMPTAHDAQLMFKVNARVMFTVSNSRAGYKNGDFGIVTGVQMPSQPTTANTARVAHATQARASTHGAKPTGNPSPVVEIRNLRTGKTVRLIPTTTYRWHMEYDEETNKLQRTVPYIQSTTQYPMKPAYAITAHKAQGQTYATAVVDLSADMFSPGQMYVALSRVKTLGGLYLTKPLGMSDIMVDPQVSAFLKKIAGEYVPHLALPVGPVASGTEPGNGSPNPTDIAGAIVIPGAGESSTESSHDDPPYVYSMRVLLVTLREQSEGADLTPAEQSLVCLDCYRRLYQAGYFPHAALELAKLLEKALARMLQANTEHTVCTPGQVTSLADVAEQLAQDGLIDAVEADTLRAVEMLRTDYVQSLSDSTITASDCDHALQGVLALYRKHLGGLADDYHPDVPLSVSLLNPYSDEARFIARSEHRFRHIRGIAAEQITNRFPPPQITYDRFMSELSLWEKTLQRYLNRMREVVNIASTRTERVDRKLKEAQSYITAIIDKTEELTLELALHTDDAEDTFVGEVDELIRAMDEVVESVSEYGEAGSERR